MRESWAVAALASAAAANAGSAVAGAAPPNHKVAALRQLSAARQALVLRHWLKSQHQTTPSTAQLRELQAQLQDCSTRGHCLHLKVGRGYVRREGDVLIWQAD